MLVPNMILHRLVSAARAAQMPELAMLQYCRNQFAKRYSVGPRSSCQLRDQSYHNHWFNLAHLAGKLHHVPEIIGRVHPNLHHSYQSTHDTLPCLLFVIVRAKWICFALLPFQLPVQDVNRRLIVLQGRVRVIAQLREVEVC